MGHKAAWSPPARSTFHSANMKFPHTHYTKGKNVWLRLDSGEEITGKFVERIARYVILDHCKVRTKYIKSMGFRNHNFRPRSEQASLNPKGLKMGLGNEVTSNAPKPKSNKRGGSCAA